jgi:glucose/arabinose dehydrogenase
VDLYEGGLIIQKGEPLPEYGNDRIQKFTSEGVFVSEWGTYGRGDGEFKYPDSVAVAPDGSVYVTYWKRTRIQKFDSAGGFVIKWGRGDPPGSSFANSRGVAVAPDGSVYVTEYNGDSVQKWSVGP